MKSKFIFLTILSALILLSCNGGKNSEVQLLAFKLDSISKVNYQNARDLAEVNSIVNTISNELDSIAVMENMININPLGNEGRKPTRSEMRERLKTFAQLLDRQKKRISQLEDSLSSLNGNTVEKYRNLISLLNNQLEEKDNIINSLMGELNKRNANIQQLQEDINELVAEKEQISALAESQKETLVVQDNLINQGYIKIGTRKELQKDGLITGGGLLSKTKVNNSNIEPSLFEEIDIRYVSEINIPSKSFKILSSMPERSYEINQTDKASSTLRITDPTLFWSISRYLIILTK